MKEHAFKTLTGFRWSATTAMCCMHACTVAESAATNTAGGKKSHRQGSNLTPLKSVHQTLTK